MKYLKTLGLIAAAAAALMGFVGTASAATLTSPVNTVLGVGTVIKATSEHVELTGSITTTCTHSVLEKRITHQGGDSPTKTVTANIEYLDFTNCGPTTITVVNGGSVEVHSIGNNTGTVTSTGLLITKLTHSFFLGTSHCIYKTNNTHLGTLKGTGHSGNTTATLEITAALLQEPTDGLCGSDAEWHADYKVNTPHHLWVD